MEDDRRRRFELLALPHLDAAYNLARWLAGNAADAEDVLQDAYLRAFRYFDAFRGPDFRVWLLSIVRNSFLSWAKSNRSARLVFGATEQTDPTVQEETLWGEASNDPETALMRNVDRSTLARLVEGLPPEYREVLLLREVEELSYRDIAGIVGVPVGTVMSRLARARLLLRRRWHEAAAREGADGM
ncbi:MAG: sigma-70 family RNA polymerase sigma factor [Acetobacteraceae bacterium]|nr:sigma-70 family RNA polymerase sigma factor [Acetobacteraceae bacterium]